MRNQLVSGYDYFFVRTTLQGDGDIIDGYDFSSHTIDFNGLSDLKIAAAKKGSQDI